VRIPPELHEQILSRAAKGHTTRQIAEWLKKSKAIDVSHVSVAAVIKKHRVERREVAKHVVESYVEKSLPKDLAELDKIQAANVALLRKAQAEAKRDLTVAAVEKVTKLTTVVQRADEAKKKALGLDQPTEQFSGLADLLAAGFEEA
jgi:hypothetical protein